MGPVEGLSQLSRSVVSPAEHVGEHHAGSGCCIALAGSGGIAGGGTTGNGLGPLAQAASSSGSAASVSLSSNRAGGLVVDDLSKGCDTAGFLGACGLGGRGDGLGVAGGGFGGQQLLAVQTPGLASQQGDQDGDDGQQGAGHACIDRSTA